MQKYHCRDFPGVPVVKTSPCSAESGVSIPRQVRSHMLPGQKPKQNRNSVVTNSIKTLKMVHIKKKKITVETTYLFIIKKKKTWETMNSRKCA